MKTGVDFSQHGGVLNASIVECWKQQGISFAIVQYSALMRDHLTVCRDGGLYTEAYVYLYWGLDPWGQSPVVRTQNALRAMQPFGVKRLWLDLEDTTHAFLPAQVDQCIGACRAAGVEPGIYTGRWWAESRLNPNPFANLPLWDALYVNQQPADLMTWKPYCGWTRPTIWQWHNTTEFCSHSVDLNVMEEEPVDPAAQEDYDDLKTHRFMEAAFARREIIFVPVAEDNVNGTLTFEVRLERNTPRPETRTTVRK